MSSFGSFKVRDKTRRIGRNPTTFEDARIAARRVVTFRVLHMLRNRIGGGMSGTGDGALTGRAALDPGHEEHDRMIEWYGRLFDPADIDENRVRMVIEDFAAHRRGPLAATAVGAGKDAPDLSPDPTGSYKRTRESTGHSDGAPWLPSPGSGKSAVSRCDSVARSKSRTARPSSRVSGHHRNSSCWRRNLTSPHPGVSHSGLPFGQAL